ncbi:phage tail assembly chaperone [Alcaligenes aquatilis]|uniref:phage tail assembly chaperone n=1 Tax=Alcaligenes aquatilis TaxID=323284 RepID=UPI000D52CCA5|nr:phage tail assembly chaperone [Alcaligenes aquatilis]AWG34020.1 hypothetical protein CA948_02195 [Alcaligenes aquatilis]
MSFKIAQRPVVGYPVSISVYDEKGKTQKLEFIAQYKRSKRPELQDLIAAARNLARKNAGLEPLAEEGGKPKEWPYTSNEGFFQAHVCGWVGVKGEDGKDLAFSHEALEGLLAEYPEFHQPLFDGFFSAHIGARAKN